MSIPESLGTSYPNPPNSPLTKPSASGNKEDQAFSSQKKEEDAKTKQVANPILNNPEVSNDMVVLYTDRLPADTRVRSKAVTSTATAPSEHKTPENAHEAGMFLGRQIAQRILENREKLAKKTYDENAPEDFKELIEFVSGLQGDVLQPIFEYLSLKDLELLAPILRSQPKLFKIIQHILPERQQLAIAQILGLYPAWVKTVNVWMNPLSGDVVSLAEKLWLLQILELNLIRSRARPDAIREKEENPFSAILDSKIAGRDKVVGAPVLLLQEDDVSKSLAQIDTLTLENCRLQACPQGLSLLTNLRVLNLSRNGLITLDDLPVSLQFLDVSHNGLTSANFSRNAQLLLLDVSYNPLTELNIDANQKLKVLEYRHTDITVINFDRNPNVSCIYADDEEGIQNHYNFLLEAWFQKLMKAS